MSMAYWDPRNTIAAVTAFLLMVLCLVPLLALVGTLDMNSNKFTDWIEIPYLVFLKSIGLAAAVAILSMIWGTLIALVLIKTHIPFKKIFLLWSVVPLAIPSYIHGLIWSRLLGTNRGLNRLGQELFSKDFDLFSLTGWSGTLLVLTFSYFPLVLLPMLVALMRWRREQQHAALQHASPFYVLWKIQLPFFSAYVLVGGLLVFLFALSNFSVPDLFQLRVYASEVFIQLTAFLDTQSALRLSFLPLLMGIALLLLLVRIGRRLQWLEQDGLSEDRNQWCSKHINIAGLIFVTLSVSVSMGLPLSYLVVMVGDWRWMIRSLPLLVPDAWNGVLYAGIACLICLILAALAAYVVSRLAKPLFGAVRLLLLFMLVVPASLIGLAYVQLWNRPPLHVLYDSGAVLVLALVARWLPVAMEMMLVFWRSMGLNQETAAFTCKASVWMTWRHILIPQLKPGLTLTGLILFLFMFGDLALIVLLAPPGISFLPLQIFSTVHYGPDQQIGALCIWMILFLSVPMLGVFWSLNQRLANRDRILRSPSATESGAWI